AQSSSVSYRLMIFRVTATDWQVMECAQCRLSRCSTLLILPRSRLPPCAASDLEDCRWLIPTIRSSRRVCAASQARPSVCRQILFVYVVTVWGPCIPEVKQENPFDRLIC